MTKKLEKLVLVIDLKHFSPDSRFIEARNFVNRALNNGTLAENDTVELEFEDSDECEDFTAKEFSSKKSL